MSSTDSPAKGSFIHRIIEKDLETNKYGGHVATRFPPEPNGYLHIGHAKSICLNFGIARQFNGHCNLRFDDTNPEKEDIEYTQAIQTDVEWLGFEWDKLCHASDYFEQLYQYAVELIQQGKAYVDSLSAEEISDYRGTLTSPGKDSPYRSRTIEENLDLFQRMRSGEFEDGAHILRAKIDMTSPNLVMRDPPMYRIRHTQHHHTGDAWCIYPLYDYTHCISDALEGVTHSLCTTEFEVRRPLYNWFLDNLPVPCHPQQIEFGRLNFEYTVVSKRKLAQLVDKGIVDGWDDPRMPTLSGMRRRGYTPTSIIEFSNRIGITKNDGTVEMSLLESCIRDDLNQNAPRRMAILRPLKVVIENYPDDAEETLTLANHPNRPELGERTLPFTREVYIDQTDFAENPPPKFKRLVLGGEVRLRYGYVIKCKEVVKNESGEIEKLICTYDPSTLGKKPEGRKVKGVIHWVPAHYAVNAEVRLYDRLFSIPEPSASGDFMDHINPHSLLTLNQCKLEPSLSEPLTSGVQFEREGYFCLDKGHSSKNGLVFNRTVQLRDEWEKIQKKQATLGT